MSFRLAGVTCHASGIPFLSTARWCLTPGRPRSTGLGPVQEPPFLPGCGWNRPIPDPSPGLPRLEAGQGAAHAARPTLPRLAIRATGASTSSLTRSRVPAEGAPTGFLSPGQTRSPTNTPGHPGAASRDSETVEDGQATAPRCAPTTHLGSPTADPGWHRSCCLARSQTPPGSLPEHDPCPRSSPSTHPTLHSVRRS